MMVPSLPDAPAERTLPPGPEWIPRREVMEAERPAGVGLMLLWSREGKFMLSTFLVAAIAIGVPGCGAATTTTVTTTVTTAVTAPPRTVTVNKTVTAPTPTTPDSSAFLERSLTDKVPGGSGHSTQSFLLERAALPR